MNQNNFDLIIALAQKARAANDIDTQIKLTRKMVALIKSTETELQYIKKKG